MMIIIIIKVFLILNQKKKGKNKVMSPYFLHKKKKTKQRTTNKMTKQEKRMAVLSMNNETKTIPFNTYLVWLWENKTLGEKITIIKGLSDDREKDRIFSFVRSLSLFRRTTLEMIRRRNVLWWDVIFEGFFFVDFYNMKAYGELFWNNIGNKYW